MSKTAVNQVIQQAVSDAAFRRQLQRDPHGALAGFDLTTDERAAVTTGDPARLTALGVDQRMSKAFNLGAVASASEVTVGDLGSASTAMIADEAGARATGALIGDPDAGADSALIAPDGTMVDAGFVGTPEAGADRVIVGDPDSALDSAFTSPAGDAAVDPGIVSDTSGGAIDDVGTSIDTGVDMSGDFRTTD